MQNRQKRRHRGASAASSRQPHLCRAGLVERNLIGRINARGPEGLLDGKAPGPRSRLNDAQRRALVDVVESGPIPAIYGVLRWRLIDLAQWLHDELAVSLDETKPADAFIQLNQA